MASGSGGTKGGERRGRPVRRGGRGDERRGLAFMSWRQTKVWHDTDTPWRHPITLDPECAPCHGNLGAYHMNTGNAVVAEFHLVRAVALRPERARYHASLGLFLGQQGRHGDAIPEVRTAIDRVPDYVDALTGLGVALINLKRTDAPLPYLERTAVDATSPPPRAGLVRAYLAPGRVDLACEAYGPLQRLDSRLAGLLRAGVPE
jgi:tetratricopeptide (TPR) repeat protein